MSPKSTVHKNSAAEEARIAEGVAGDADTFVPSDAEWAKLFGDGAGDEGEPGRARKPASASVGPGKRAQPRSGRA